MRYNVRQSSVMKLASFKILLNLIACIFVNFQFGVPCVMGMNRGLGCALVLKVLKQGSDLPSSQVLCSLHNRIQLQ